MVGRTSPHRYAVLAASWLLPRIARHTPPSRLSLKVKKHESPLSYTPDLTAIPCPCTCARPSRPCCSCCTCSGTSNLDVT
eukprot:4867473-Prymnesium_polylepis.1